MDINITYWRTIVANEQGQAARRINAARKELSDAEYAHALAQGGLNLLAAIEAEAARIAAEAAAAAEAATMPPDAPTEAETAQD